MIMVTVTTKTSTGHHLLRTCDVLGTIVTAQVRSFSLTNNTRKLMEEDVEYVFYG
jgi:hypothetical protein